MGAPSRYEFFATCQTFTQSLVDALVNDPHWTASRTTHAQGLTSFGASILTNKLKADMVFTLIMIQASSGYKIRYGLKPQPSTTATAADLFNAWAGGGETAITLSSNNTQNVNYKFVVFTNEDYIFIHGDPQDFQTVAFTINIFMGKCTPHGVEDPVIANGFFGIFPYLPLNENQDSNLAAGRGYFYGAGGVSMSRNAESPAQYRFTTNSNLVSPGADGSYFLSPFYVFQYNEGVRGEFKDLRTAVLKDGSMHPDGSVLEVGADRYYVYHVPNLGAPTNGGSTYQTYISSPASYKYVAPYFFDSGITNGGQRVLLFKI